MYGLNINIRTLNKMFYAAYKYGGKREIIFPPYSADE